MNVPFLLRATGENASCLLLGSHISHGNPFVIIFMFIFCIQNTKGKILTCSHVVGLKRKEDDEWADGEVREVSSKTFYKKRKTNGIGLLAFVACEKNACYHWNPRRQTTNRITSCHVSCWLFFRWVLPFNMTCKHALCSANIIVIVIAPLCE